MFIKMRNKQYFFCKLIVILLCLTLMFSVSGCGKPVLLSDINSTESVDSQQPSSDAGTDAESGNSQLNSFIIPSSLFYGKTAEALMEEIRDPENALLLESGEEVVVSDIISDVYLNDDGTLTYVLTDEQLAIYKQFLHDVATLNRLINGTVTGTLDDTQNSAAKTSIKKTEFGNEALTDLVVYVDKKTYDNSGFDGIIANLYAPTYMGMYQIMNGADPYEWYVHVSVKDYETGEIITEDYYPND